MPTDRTEVEDERKADDSGFEPKNGNAQKLKRGSVREKVVFLSRFFGGGGRKVQATRLELGGHRKYEMPHGHVGRQPDTEVGTLKEAPWAGDADVGAISTDELL